MKKVNGFQRRLREDESIGDKGYPRRHETPRLNDTHRTKCITNTLGFGSRTGGRNAEQSTKTVLSS